MNTDINNTVTATDGTRQFDACAKRVMAHRSILGNVLTRVLPVLKGMDPQKVADLILPDIYVGTVPIDPGSTNKAATTDNGDRVVGFNTEDKEINEGEARFDLIFYIRIPRGISRVIVNIEMQRKRPTEYPLLNRAVYYTCRAISSQKERDFRGRHYGDIKDTYSIWICMNEQTNSICDYRLVRDQIMGDAEWPAILDLMHVLLIGVSNDVPEPCESNALHRLLCTLFSEKNDQ